MARHILKQAGALALAAIMTASLFHPVTAFAAGTSPEIGGGL